MGSYRSPPLLDKRNPTNIAPPLMDKINGKFERARFAFSRPFNSFVSYGCAHTEIGISHKENYTR